MNFVKTNGEFLSYGGFQLNWNFKYVAVPKIRFGGLVVLYTSLNNNYI